MTARDFLAGAFLFVAGMALAFAIAYRRQIALYLKLQEDGTVTAATDVLGGVQTLISKFSPLNNRGTKK
jgi:hypothetical protein